MENLGVLVLPKLKISLLHMLIVEKITVVIHIKANLLHHIKISILQSSKPRLKIFSQESKMKMLPDQSKTSVLFFNLDNYLVVQLIIKLFNFNLKSCTSKSRW